MASGQRCTLMPRAKRQRLARRFTESARPAHQGHEQHQDSQAQVDRDPYAKRCQGDTTGGYRWNAFLASSRVDLDSLSVQSGLVRAANETYPHIDSLYSTTTTPQTNRSTAIGTGQIVGLVNLDFSTNQVFENGVYQIGIFCSLGGTQTRRWSTSITSTTSATATARSRPGVTRRRAIPIRRSDSCASSSCRRRLRGCSSG